MFNSVTEAFEWMVSFTNLEKKPDLTLREYRLDKMERLLEIFGNPHKSFKSIHVAGSKGKGSTCAFLASILTEAGFKTGIYSSPHLLDYRERITNNHSFFTDSVYLETIDEIKAFIDKMEDNFLPGGAPTTFELITLAAFIIFKKEKCDWVVVETGLGGRLDSTNCVLPEASIITPIELEHTDLLGDTIEKIAYEKAGIIKKNRPVFTSNREESVLSTIREAAEKQNSELYRIPEGYNCTTSSSGTILDLFGTKYKVGIKGAIQGENALLAITAIRKIMPEISLEDISKGIERTKIPGRFQVVDIKPEIVLDGAHTKKSISGTIDTFLKIYKKGVIIFGAVQGKDIDAMAEIVSGHFDKIIISTPGNFKESNLDEIENIFNKIGKNVLRRDKPVEALHLAREYGIPILVTGSFYMAGEIGKLI